MFFSSLSFCNNKKNDISNKKLLKMSILAQFSSIITLSFAYMNQVRIFSGLDSILRNILFYAYVYRSPNLLYLLLSMLAILRPMPLYSRNSVSAFGLGFLSSFSIIGWSQTVTMRFVLDTDSFLSVLRVFLLPG